MHALIRHSVQHSCGSDTASKAPVTGILGYLGDGMMNKLLHLYNPRIG
jgi:hypothetical protein